MLGYVGKYQRQLDERGRLILPAKIREKLSETVIVAPSPTDECLNLYPEEEWQAIAEKVSALPTVTNRSAAAFQRWLFGNAISCEIDKQGRIPLNEELMEYAGMEKDVVIVAVNSKFEIWAGDKLVNPTREKMREDIAEFDILI